MGCHNSDKSAFKPTEAQAQEFQRLQHLFSEEAQQQEKKDNNDDEPHFYD
ncbi:MAG: hypothetical protein NT124_02235 [Candidatus Dependentiae bacterium]|nr:hypothetical protein [Candidatus Dependentiae bacterium]